MPSDSDFADVILQADPGYSVASKSSLAGHRNSGDHGWAREAKDMHGIFLATGPRLPKGKRLPEINNVDVYPLMMEVLGLPVITPIDGDAELLPSLLAP